MKQLTQEQVDKLFKIIDQYIDGVITAEEAVNSIAATLGYPAA